jgi:general secretion pathway protein I
VKRHGFTLLEVMVAMAILAIALTSLLGSQSQSLYAADEANFSMVSALLAQEKMAELVVQDGYLTDYSGDFGDRHPGYFWRAEVVQSDFSEIETLEGTEDLLGRIDLVVHTTDERRSFTISRYVLLGLGNER